MDSREYQTVILGALLHDIGKFFQRGRSLPFPVEGKHPEVSATFVRVYADVFASVTNIDALEAIVHHHHQGRSFAGMTAREITDPRQRALAHLVSTADHLSSRERGEHSASYQDYHTTPLALVFQRLYVPDPTGSLRNVHPVPLTGPEELGDQHLPDAALREYAPGELEKLLREGFGPAWLEVAKAIREGSFDTFLARLLDLLHRYTWCIPADTQEDFPDVSLFDHLKTTSAIAACLYQYADRHGQLSHYQDRVLDSETEERFCLVVGDLSGIQDYIFRITSGGDPEGKGTARRLRARSLFIQMLTDVLAHRILHRLQLPLTNILMASGGRFYLLLPNLPETEQLLQGVVADADQWCRDQLNGEIAANLSWVVFGDDGFKQDANTGWSSILRRVNDKLAEAKARRLQSVLVTPKPIAAAGTKRPCSSLASRVPVLVTLAKPSLKLVARMANSASGAVLT